MRAPLGAALASLDATEVYGLAVIAAVICWAVVAANVAERRRL